MNTTLQLHDSTLKKIELDWTTGWMLAILTAGAEQREVRIVGKAVKSFTYDRNFPWGRSVSVNHCTIEQIQETAVLKLEMQSGDMLTGKGESFHIS